MADATGLVGRAVHDRNNSSGPFQQEIGHWVPMNVILVCISDTYDIFQTLIVLNRPQKCSIVTSSELVLSVL